MKPTDYFLTDREMGRPKMKRNNGNRNRVRMAPLKIDLREDEILADLHYPAVERPVTVRPDDKRTPSR